MADPKIPATAAFTESYTLEQEEDDNNNLASVAIIAGVAAVAVGSGAAALADD